MRHYETTTLFIVNKLFNQYFPKDAFEIFSTILQYTGLTIFDLISIRKPYNNLEKLILENYELVEIGTYLPIVPEKFHRGILFFIQQYEKHYLLEQDKEEKIKSILDAARYQAYRDAMLSHANLETLVSWGVTRRQLDKIYEVADPLQRNNEISILLRRFSFPRLVWSLLKGVSKDHVIVNAKIDLHKFFYPELIHPTSLIRKLYENNGNLFKEIHQNVISQKMNIRLMYELVCFLCILLPFLLFLVGTMIGYTLPYLTNAVIGLDCHWNIDPDEYKKNPDSSPMLPKYICNDEASCLDQVSSWSDQFRRLGKYTLKILLATCQQSPCGYFSNYFRNDRYHIHSLTTPSNRHLSVYCQHDLSPLLFIALTTVFGILLLLFTMIIFGCLRKEIFKILKNDCFSVIRAHLNASRTATISNSENFMSFVNTFNHRKKIHDITPDRPPVVVVTSETPLLSARI